jgi:hypothetical protein
MTMDDTALATALRDLAETAPDDPARLSHVHHLARRRHRRQRVIGAGALAATIAAAGFGADALASGGATPSAGIRPASGGAAAPAAGSPGAASAPSGRRTDAPLPSCSSLALSQPSNKSVPPPTVGQQFTGGGTVSAPGTASSVTIQVDGGPLVGSDLTLMIGPSSQIFVNGKPATGAQLATGTRAKFAATRLTTTTYFVDELHAGTADAAAAAKEAAPGVPAPPAVGENFKVAGSVTAATTATVTVDVQGGSLPPGPYTFTLKCTPASPLVGKMVSVVGTRTGASTYVASMVLLAGS